MTVSIEQSKYRIIAFTILISILLFPNIVLPQQQLQPCPYEWCPEGMGYIKKDCPSGLQPCPDFTCKQSCSGVVPIIPQGPYTQPQSQFDWNYLWAFLAGLVVAFIFIKFLKTKKMKK
jgi:hypothetical protein